MMLLWSLLSLSLTLPGTWNLECYSFQRTFNGPFDLSSLQMSIVTCQPGQDVCLEAVSSMSTGYRNSLTIVKKGCSSGTGSGEMISEGNSLPPDYTMVRQCQESLCNRQIENHNRIPNLSAAPDPPELSGTECWACISTTAEGCELYNAHKIKCHAGQSVCYQGKGFLAIDNFNKTVYIRTCHEPTCTFTGTATHRSDNYLKGTCCKGNLCNKVSNVPKPPPLANIVLSGAPTLLALPLLPAIPLLLGI